MTKQLETLLQREMTRKEFLTVVGVGVASVFGFSSILRILNIDGHLTHGGNKIATGYGSSAYGGSAEKSLSAS